MTTSAQAEDFWRFTLEIYARPDVSSRCIELQDEHGRDVNILLYCLYAGLILGRRLGGTELALLESAAAPWTETVTQKLRAARRSLKTWAEDPQVAELRRMVQAAEIDAERLAQARLETALPESPVAAPGPTLARDNLRAYAGDAAEALAVAALQ
jgi:uncharacterized protein (TIGR02444 family)